MDALNLQIEFLSVKPESLKLEPFRHVAVIGRSNVGKSSLINMLSKRQQAAYISSNPGKTRTLNFYKTQYPLYLVDMPGYGYARVSKTEREKWHYMIQSYFALFQDRMLLFLLIDARHPVQPADVEFFLMARSYSMPKIVCLTKTDQAGQKEIAICRKSLKNILSEIGSDYQVVESSSKTGKGKKDLLKLIAEYQDKP